MQLSSETVEILKNFSTIKEMIFVKSGNVIKTESVSQTVRAEATVEENFPSDFGIYDLKKFLAKLSLHRADGFTADIEFFPDKIKIVDGAGKRANFIKLCPVDFIGYPEEMGDIEIHHEFVLSANDLAWISRSAAISGSPHYIFESKGDGNISMIATDIKDSSSDVSNLIIDSNDVHKDKMFRMVFSIQNFVLQQKNNYKVQLNTDGVGIFTRLDNQFGIPNKNQLKYYIGAELEN